MPWVLFIRNRGRIPEAQEEFAKVAASGKSDLAAQAAIAIADLLAREDEPDKAIDMYQENSRITLSWPI